MRPRPGKSDLAIALAQRFDGEIVNADAYQLYRGLDIGTAKVSAETRQRLPHHLIDVTRSDRPLALARYLDLALAALDDVWSRDKLPILVGGNGRYVWALLEGWQVPRVPPDLALRAELEALGAAERCGGGARASGGHRPGGRGAPRPEDLRGVVARPGGGRALGRPLAACRPASRWTRTCWCLGCACRVRSTCVAWTPALSHVRRGLIEEVRGLRERAGARPRRCAAASATRK